MNLKCLNRIKGKLCGYEWDYNGKARFYATCPRCLRKVKIPQ